MIFREASLRNFLGLILLLSVATNVGAQTLMDPSSALLLSPESHSSGRSSVQETSDNRSESGRYTVRPRSAPVSAAPIKRTPVEPLAAPPVPQGKVPPVVLVPAEQGEVVVEINPVVVSDPPAPPVPRERRILEISIATAYLYENSESGYSYRQMNMGGPAYGGSARAWFSSEFAIGGSYFSTLGGQVSDRSSSVSASKTDLSYGLFFRKNFSSSNLVFAVEYMDSEFKVSSDTVSKVKTRSSGVRVSMDGEFSATPTSSWSLGFSVMPKLQHSETAAATNVRSGTSVNTYAVGASLRRSWKFDSAHAVFMSLEHRVERDLFTGAASAPDAVSGVTPSGVAVTIGTTLIQFGYSWGD